LDYVGSGSTFEQLLSLPLSYKSLGEKSKHVGVNELATGVEGCPTEA
jgi:hypothetical protein